MPVRLCVRNYANHILLRCTLSITSRLNRMSLIKQTFPFRYSTVQYQIGSCSYLIYLFGIAMALKTSTNFISVSFKHIYVVRVLDSCHYYPKRRSLIKRGEVGSTSYFSYINSLTWRGGRCSFYHLQ